MQELNKYSHFLVKPSTAFCTISVWRPKILLTGKGKIRPFKAGSSLYGSRRNLALPDSDNSHELDLGKNERKAKEMV